MNHSPGIVHSNMQIENKQRVLLDSGAGGNFIRADLVIFRGNAEKLEYAVNGCSTRSAGMCTHEMKPEGRSLRRFDIRMFLV